MGYKSIYINCFGIILRLQHVVEFLGDLPFGPCWGSAVCINAVCNCSFLPSHYISISVFLRHKLPRHFIKMNVYYCFIPIWLRDSEAEQNKRKRSTGSRAHRGIVLGCSREKRRAQHRKDLFQLNGIRARISDNN